MDDDTVSSKASGTGARIVELTSAQTHDLRARVLRVGTPSSSLDWPGDDLGTTVHLGVVIGDSDSPVAISTWLRATSPDGDGDGDGSVGMQLRGMATDPTVRGQGLGGILLRAGLARAEQHDVDHAWANARSAVLGFYLAHGFVVTSDEFLSTDTALPHRRILRTLRPA